MAIGQAYSRVLTLRAQESLEIGCNWLIDHSFEDYVSLSKSKNIAEDIDQTVLGEHLPDRYLSKYTPFFFKQFTVCIVTVAWKLAQPEHYSLSSVAEELAAWAIINQAKALTEEDEDGEVIADILDQFEDAYFEDLDFEFLFDDAYDGIDKDEVNRELGISSLSFDNWFKPFSDEPDRIPHPYVV
jgi:hypothetical protein